MPEWFGKGEQPARPPQRGGPSSTAVFAVLLLAGGAAAAFYLGQTTPAPVTARDPLRPLTKSSEPEAQYPASSPPELQQPEPLPLEEPPGPQLRESLSEAQPPQPASAEPPLDKADESPAEASAPPFSRDAARQALLAASSTAASCGKAEGRSGTTSVRLTFTPSGRASVVQVAGAPFAGTPTGSCIAAAMRSARVPAFSGSAVTVTKNVKVD